MGAKIMPFTEEDEEAGDGSLFDGAAPARRIWGAVADKGGALQGSAKHGISPFRAIRVACHVLA